MYYITLLPSFQERRGKLFCILFSCIKYIYEYKNIKKANNIKAILMYNLDVVCLLILI